MNTLADKVQMLSELVDDILRSLPRVSIRKDKWAFNDGFETNVYIDNFMVARVVWSAGRSAIAKQPFIIVVNFNGGLGRVVLELGVDQPERPIKFEFIVLEPDEISSPDYNPEKEVKAILQAIFMSHPEILCT